MLKAIETVYDGYRFRSRLEARWAVFFKTLGIKYEYEKEEFELEDGMRYLPDFWLPEQQYWIEINNAKGSGKVFSLAELTKKSGFLISGQMIPYVTEQSKFDEFPQIDPVYDEGYVWCECPDCGFIGIAWSGYSDRLSCKQCEICYLIEHRKTCEKWLHPTGRVQGRIIPGCYQCVGEKVYEVCPRHGANPHKGCPLHSAKMSKYPNYDTPRLIDAYTAARQARFEHGERGQS